MTKRTLTALYDRYDEATAAVAKLEAAGIPHDDISLVANKGTTETGAAGTGTGTTAAHGDTAENAETGAGTGATLGTILGGGAGLLAGLGLLAIPGIGPVVAAGWLVSTLTGAGIGAAIGGGTGGLVGSLTGAGVHEADAHRYAEGVRRGGTLLTVRAGDDHATTAMDILEEHGAIDLDERTENWKADGWTGTSTTEAAAPTAAAPTAPAPTKAAALDTGARNDVSKVGDGNEAIPIVEERLQVGKRDVEQGRVRVRSYAVETPVQEQVELRHESVHVDRRPVDRALGAGEAALFNDRTIEAVERHETPVVSKEARVVEEVGLRKEATQRTETVNDTVRRTEVEVEDERGNVSRTGTADPSVRR